MVRRVALVALPIIVLAVLAAAQFVASDAAQRRQAQPVAPGPLDDALSAAKRRSAEPAPFDLTYLPPSERQGNGPSALVTVRPCVLFDRPGGERLEDALLRDTGILQAVQEITGLRSVPFPRFADLDMALFRVHTNITREGEDGAGSFQAWAYNGVVLRTRERFDWEDVLRRMDPQPQVVLHRGKELRVLAVDFRQFATMRAWLTPGFRPEEAVLRIGLIAAPDGRTLVIDTEDAVKKLIDRMADGGAAPEPVGWDAVSRCALAAAVANPEKAWAWELPGAEGPRLPKGGDWEWAFFDDLETCVVGLDVRPTTRVRVTAKARDPFAGARLAWNMRRLLALGEAHVAAGDSPGAEVMQALWKNGTFTPTRFGFEITADAGADLIGPLLDSLAIPTPPAARFGDRPAPIGR